jgi:transposase
MANMLERLVFIDETSLKTNLVKTTGWAPVGKRLVDHAPFGHWHTQTFIAGLAHDGLIAPWVLDGAMNRDSFETYITRELAPALRPGQIVVADNLAAHKSSRAIELLRAQGNDLIFLPPYSPDMNPIEMAFSKLKTLIRKAAARTYEALITRQRFGPAGQSGMDRASYARAPCRLQPHNWPGFAPPRGRLCLRR